MVDGSDDAAVLIAVLIGAVFVLVRSGVAGGAVGAAAAVFCFFFFGDSPV